MAVVAEKPQAAIGTLSDVGARPVAPTVLGDPRANDRPFLAEAVGDLAEDLDSLEVGYELELGSCVGSSRAGRRLRLRHGRYRLVHDLRLPGGYSGKPTAHHVYLRPALEIGGARRSEHARQSRFAAVATSPLRYPAIEENREVDRYRLVQPPVQM